MCAQGNVPRYLLALRSRGLLADASHKGGAIASQVNLP